MRKVRRRHDSKSALLVDEATVADAIFMRLIVTIIVRGFIGTWFGSVSANGGNCWIGWLENSVFYFWGVYCLVDFQYD